MVQESHVKDLDGRSRKVLKTLIRDYVRGGKPVGSQRLSELYHERLSPATLRSVMADLERAGYLTQPHTSAGRMPTRQGYRFYVQSLLSQRGLLAREEGEIKKRLTKETDPAELMDATSRLLSDYSNSIGIVLSPPISGVAMKHIEFVRLSRKRILVIMVSTSGLVRQRLVFLDEDLTQAELDQAGRYLAENFAAKSLREIRLKLLSMMSKEKALYDRLIRNVILLGSATLKKEETSPDEPLIYFGGASHVLGRLQDIRISRLVELLQTLEEKKRLVKIITECIEEAKGEPTVTIGLEEHVPGLRNWTLITSAYHCGHGSRGSVGILGPCRMEYEKAISLVDFVARMFEQLMAVS